MDKFNLAGSKAIHNYSGRNYALLAALGSQFQIYCLGLTGYNNASEKGF
jgi:hypothetical protein